MFNELVAICQLGGRCNIQWQSTTVSEVEPQISHYYVEHGKHRIYQLLATPNDRTRVPFADFISPLLG